jgi:ABC-type transport system involved in cytochrome c biogenesis permease subunit
VLGLGLPEQFDATLRAGLAADFEQLRRGWQFQDVAATNDAIQALVTALPAIEPALYPSATRRQIESFYLRAGKLTWGWLFYLAALVPLLLGFTRGSDRALRLGWSLFAAALVIHTAAIGLRWYIAGRIPNANMFEAICASSWFGAVVALVIERAIRRSGKRGLPTLAGAVTGMTALMAGHFLPVSLSSEIAPVMPILDRTVWLYIHTNLVIASYALIFCGAVTAVLYLLRRLAHAGGESLTLLDGTTMIFLQLAFVTLWVGTVLGAVWADVSWGRPWGWDPKEVFALNTWLVFLMLLHVRLRTRDKGLWTAWLAVIGCAVMLFNWIAVNFVIVGLHSYA